jgi:hypothetical protein
VECSEESYPKIDWPRIDLDAWIATFEGFDEVRALLEASAFAGQWIATRVTGPDPDDVRAIGIRLFVKEFITGVMESDAWRVSHERFADAGDKARRLLVEGQVFHHHKMFLHGLAVTEQIELSGIVLRQPTRDELVVAYNRGPSDRKELTKRHSGAVQYSKALSMCRWLPVLSCRLNFRRYWPPSKSGLVDP